MTKLDPDDFTVWREHPVTQRVFAHIKAMAVEREQECSAGLYMAAAGMPSEFAARQPYAAFVRGQNDGFDYVLNLTVEQLSDE